MLSACSSYANMPPKKRSRDQLQPKADGESLVWSDEEIGLLLEVIKAYKAQHDFDGVEWESVKDKYEDIRSNFVELYRGMHLSHDETVFTRDKIASKVKDLRKKFRKALDSGRISGGGRTVAAFYDACSGIWGGSPATRSLDNGLESTQVNPDELSGGADSSDDGSVNTESDKSEGNRAPAVRRDMITHIKEQRNRKLTKEKSRDAQVLDVAKQELALKKDMLCHMKELDKDYKEGISKLASSMEVMSKSMANAFSTMSSIIAQQHQPINQPYGQFHGQQQSQNYYYTPPTFNEQPDYHLHEM